MNGANLLDELKKALPIFFMNSTDWISIKFPPANEYFCHLSMENGEKWRKTVKKDGKLILTNNDRIVFDIRFPVFWLGFAAELPCFYSLKKGIVKLAMLDYNRT